MNTSPIPITVWGPLEPKRKLGPGWRHILLGFAGMFVLSLAFGLVVAYIVSATADDNVALSESMSQLLTSSGPGVVGGLLVLWTAWLFAVWMASRATEGGFKALVGWGIRWKVDVPVGLGIGVGAQGLTLLLGLLVSALSQVPEENLGNTGMVTSVTGIWLPIVTLGATVGAPIVEELFFRGLVLPVIARRWGNLLGVIVSSVLFGVMHIQSTFASSVYTVTMVTMVGMLLGYLKVKTGRIGATIAAHIALNSVGLAATYLLAGL